MYGVVPLPHIYLHGLLLNCYVQGQIGFYYTSRPILYVFFTVCIFQWWITSYWMMIHAFWRSCNTFQIISSMEQRRRTPPKWKPSTSSNKELHHRTVVSLMEMKASCFKSFWCWINWVGAKSMQGISIYIICIYDLFINAFVTLYFNYGTWEAFSYAMTGSNVFS
jgi:hypothetical protein